MNKTLLSLLAVWLILPMPATATHLAPDEPHPQLPVVPEEPVVETDIIPVDHAQEEAAREANDAVDAMRPVVDFADRRAQDLRDAVPAPGILRIVHDDLGGDTRGVFDDWQTHGTGAWGGGLDGSGVYQTGTEAGGFYRANAFSLLVTPELDLRTGFADPVLQQAPVPDLVNAPALTMSSIYRFAMLRADYATNTDCYVGAVGGCQVVGPGQFFRTDADSRDGVYAMEYDRRHNLAARAVNGQLRGNDGVQVMVFTSPPSLEDVDACRFARDWTEPGALGSSPDSGTNPPRDPPCTIVQPVQRSNAPTGRWGAPVEALDGAHGYTGFSGWTRDQIDLTRWAERSVWVGFLFASGPVSGQTYFQSGLFDSAADFYGFDLDNLTVTAPAPANSLRVRPFAEPSFTPAGRAVPTVALGDPVPVRADVVNRGTQPVEAELMLRVLRADDRAVVMTVPLGDVALHPSQSHRIELTLNGLTATPSSYILQIDGTRTEGANFTEEADPADNVQELRFDVGSVPHLETLGLLRSQSTVEAGQQVSYRLTLQNRGNVPAVAEVDGELINALNRMPVQGAPFATGTPASRTVTVPPGQTLPVWWNLTMSDPGRYHMFVRVNDDDPFSQEDLVPSGLAPARSAWSDAGAPTIDGTLGGEWPDWSRHDRECWDSYPRDPDRRTCSLYALNNATHLWLAGSAPNTSPQQSDTWRLFLDVGADAPVEVTQNATWAMAQPGTATAWEAAIPLTALPAGVSAGAGQTLRLLAELEDHIGGGQHRFIRLPPAPRIDGEGLLSPDGSQRDEMDSWLPLELAVPPQEDPGGTARVVGLGFGVERSPPPFLELDFRSCDGLDGWSQTFIRTEAAGGFQSSPAYDETSVKWNCAKYGVDGKARLYEGHAPTSRCGAGACPPWSQMVLDEDDRAENTLVSPPIHVEAVADPYLLLRHQYSTEVYIADQLSQLNSNTGRLGLIDLEYVEHEPVEAGFNLNPYILTSFQVPEPLHGLLRIEGLARVHVQEYDEETDRWKNPVLLRPEGGYSTEASVGIEDLARGARTHTAVSSAFTSDTRPGWWHPTGLHPHYQPPGEDIATGAVFNGSRWRIDRLPLFGAGHGEDGSDTLDLAGKTVRLRFSFTNALGDPGADRESPRDYGWRIDAMSIGEGRQLSKDIAVTAVDVDAPLYDAVALGLGPGTTVGIHVTVRNEGVQPIDSFRLCVRPLDVSLPPPGDPDMCAGNEGSDHFGAVVPQALAPGEERIHVVPVDLPDEGPVLVFGAAARLPAGDDFPANNEHLDPQAYEVRRSPNLGVRVGTDKPVAPPGDTRSLLVELENRGNVPLTGFAIERAVLREDGAALKADQWQADPGQANGHLAVGERKSLSALGLSPAATLDQQRFRSPQGLTGAFTLLARVHVGDDIDPSDNVATIPLRSVSALLDEGYDSPDSLGTVNGTDGVWSVQGGRLRAGNATTGEIPLHSDATVELTRTPIDLRSAKAATLTFQHTYDLEAAPDGGFDGGRVEISTDDGATWRPLRPQPNPLQGLPDGYPSLPMTGDGAFAVEAPDETAVAFTGRSRDIPGAEGDEGWVPVTFDLSQDDGLTRRAFIDEFSLAGFSRSPGSPTVRGDDVEFRSADWTVPDEENPESRFRYWWIQNLTFDRPVPHSGDKMWWSGTAGPDIRDPEPQMLRDDQELVENWLAYRFAAPASLPDGRGDQPLLLTWWEWRAGGAEGGTGARYAVSLNGNDVEPTVLADGAGGWRRAAVDITGLQGEQVVHFDYDSATRSGFNDPRAANNAGWFLDDFQVVSYLHNERLRLRHSPLNVTEVDTLEGLDPGDALDGAGAWTSGVAAATPPRADLRWSLVGASESPRPGGWHVENVHVPGQGSTPAWRFADNTRQGYPYGAESRLVTPLVDLEQARGDLKLRFDHQYWFEALTKTPEGDGGAFLSAVDGGAVEYQVFDPATGTFGRWQPMGEGFDDYPASLRFDARAACGGCSAWERHVDRVSSSGGGRTHADWNGYPAIAERGIWWEGETGASSTLVATERHPAGVGSSLAGFHDAVAQTEIGEGANLYLKPWEPYPVSFVFSGASQGVDGWSSEAWDVSPLAGKRVRFAFHAFSNPSHDSEEGFPPDPAKRGWSLANVRVEGDVFDGKEVRLRLHLATDGSLGAGDWRIDDLAVVGERFRSNAAVLLDGPPQRVADHGETVTFRGRVATLGQQPLSQLAVALVALRESNLQPYPAERLEITYDEEQVEPIADPGALAANAVAALRVGVLDIDTLPSKAFTVNVTLPDADDAVILRWFLLEETSAGVYEPPRLDVPGNVLSQWRAAALHETRMALEPPTEVQRRVLVVTPASAEPGQEILLESLLHNTGTTEPDDLEAVWKVQVVERSGEEGRVETVGTETVPLPPVPRSETLPLSHAFTPQQAGLYRGVLEIRSSAGVLAQAQTDLLVGMSGTYHASDFGSGQADAMGWTDGSPSPDAETGGGSPQHLRFRDVGDRFLWGVTDTEFGQGSTYCTGATCVFSTTVGRSSSPPPPDPPTVHGLEGIARGPLIPLDRVPQGQAHLTIHHGHNFEADDGARVEFRPLAPGSPTEPGDREYAFYCTADTPASFVLRPEQDSHYGGIASSRDRVLFPGGPPSPGQPPPPGESAPARQNPLGTGVSDRPRVIGGDPAGDVVTRFALDQDAAATCDDGSVITENLVGYLLEPTLHVGTRPGYRSSQDNPGDHRSGAQGWSIRSLQVSSLSLDATPEAPTYPVQTGAPKTFYITVANGGEVQDRVQVLLDATATVPDAGWIVPPAGPLTLAPGEVMRLPVRVAVPSANVQPGAYMAPLRVQSLSDPNTFDIVDARIQVRTLHLPDLVVTLTTDGSGSTFEAGKVEPVHATIFNVGASASRRTDLVLESVDAAGIVAPLDRVAVPALCPPGDVGADCAGPSSASFQFEWPVPTTLGPYLLRARVDDADIVNEEDETNNLQSLQVLVEPLRQADVAVESLTISGVGPDGFAEEGTVVEIQANVTNVGGAVADNVRIKVRFGSSTIKEERIQVLLPGETRSLSVLKVVSRGEFVVGASVQHDAVDRDIDNDDRRVPLRVRGHDLLFAAPPIGIQPGGTREFGLNVTNDGNAVERVRLLLEDGSWGLGVLPNPVTVAPGQTVALAAVVTAPEDAPSGRLLLRVLAEYPGGGAAFDLPVEVAARPDAPSIMAQESTRVPGEATVSVEVTSRSNFEETWSLRLASPAWPSDEMSFTLPGGANRSLELPLTVPSSAPVGPTELSLVLLDANGTERARHRTTLDVLPAAAAEATWVGAGRVSEEGLGSRSVTFDLRVTNTGNVPWRPQVFIRDLSAGLHTTVGGEGETLAPQQSRLVPIRVHAAPDVAALYGRVELRIRPEGDETSSLAQDLLLPGIDDAPNLRLAGVELLPRNDIRAGRPARATVMVENDGKVAAPENTLLASVNGFLLEAVPLPEIAAGGSTVVNVTVTFTEAGAFLLAFHADGEGVVSESEKGDNALTVEVDVAQSGLSDRVRDVPGAGLASCLAALAALLVVRRRRDP